MPFYKISSYREHATHNSRFRTMRDDESHAVDSDSQDVPDFREEELPPPRRSAASRFNLRRRMQLHNLNRHSHLVKWVMLLLLLGTMLRYGPFCGRAYPSRPSECAVLLWNGPLPPQSPQNSWWTYSECGCVITSQRNYSEQPFDAIVFNADRSYTLDGLEAVSRSSNFLAVFAASQPLSKALIPMNTGPKPPYNLTMSYRLDSDVVWTEYYLSEKRGSKRQINFEAADENFWDAMPMWQASLVRRKLALKQRLAFYLLYEVNDQTMAESLYLEKVRKHIQLEAQVECLDPNDCAWYKFMLIFEPTGCPDYVHPEFYTALKNYIVPVVIGGANLTHLAPPGSYVASCEFASPRELAEYLIQVGENAQDYEKFHGWRHKYKLQQVHQPYCALCRLLRERRLSHRYLSNASEFRQWLESPQHQCPSHGRQFSLS